MNNMAQTEQKVGFGLGSLEKETPLWAKWIFRGYFVFSKALIGWLAATQLFPKETLIEVVYFITLLLDPIFFGLSKLFGVQVDQAEPGEPLLADKQLLDNGDNKAISPVIVNAPIASPTDVAQGHSALVSDKYSPPKSPDRMIQQ